MRYVWEYFQQNEKADVTLRPLEDCSPYLEISENGFLDPGTVSYNPFLRYGNVMQKLWDLTSEKDDFLTLFDVCSKVLIEADLMDCVTVEQREKSCLRESILQGIYGSEITKEFTRLSDEEREKLIHSLWMAKKSSQKSSYLFAEAVITNLQAAGVYRDRENPKKIIIFMGHKKNEKEERTLRMLSFFLLPMENTYEILWDRPFNVMGVEELMKINELVMMREQD